MKVVFLDFDGCLNFRYERARIHLPSGIEWDRVEGVDVGRFPMPMIFLSRRDPMGHGVEVRCEAQVTDRDKSTQLPGPPIQIGLSAIVHRFDDESLLEALLFRLAKDVLLHELAECWLVDGVRTRDPHAGRTPT